MKNGKLFAKLVAELIPFVGSIIDNKVSKDGGEGNLQLGKLLKSIVRIGGTVLITWLAKG